MVTEKEIPSALSTLIILKVLPKGRSIINETIMEEMVTANLVLISFRSYERQIDPIES